MTANPIVEHVITLDARLPARLAAEFAKRVFFASEDIRDFRLVETDGRVDAIRVTTVDGRLPNGLAEKLRFVLRNDVLPQLAREPKVIWRSAAHRECPAGTFESLVDKGIAYSVGEGQVALGQPVLDLMDDLDRLVRRIVVGDLGATEFRYPTLIPISALHRCDYFTSFPQFAMFATRLRADVDTYREFVGDLRAGADIGAEILDRCAEVAYCLPPTMCYHTFNQFAGRALPPELSVVTARGKSFRHEARYHRTLARLWDFTIREIVFFGSRDEVLTARARFLDRIHDVVDVLELSGRCEVASDPFFCAADSGARSSSQRLLELKYELQLDIGPDEAIAVGSFNFHERFFGQSFDITLADGHTIPHTGCVGFGLERLAFAVICQHGVDAAAWPAGMRQALAQARERW